MVPPPVFPDVAHVANGCFVSTVVYLARFFRAFPAERGEAAAVVLPNADGLMKPHTLAVVSWHGQWWARDEYYGVFTLAASAAAPWDPMRLQRRAQEALPQNAARQTEQGRGLRRAAAPAPGDYPPRRRLREIEQARRLLPCDSEIHWFGSGPAAAPFLFFRLGGEAFAVYDPSTGTATAKSPVDDGARLVAAVAHRMGYGVSAPSLASCSKDRDIQRAARNLHRAPLPFAPT